MTMRLFAMMCCLLAVVGCDKVGPKANCKQELSAQGQPTVQSKDCITDLEVCVSVTYDVQTKETATICAPLNELCSPVQCATGKECHVVNGIPTCDWISPPKSPCETWGMTCSTGFQCALNSATNEPFCDSTSGFPNGAACTADAQCQSAKCVGNKCVAACTTDANCATTEWCDTAGTKTCKADLADGQTVCNRPAQCVSGNCDVNTGKCLPMVSGACSTDSQCTDAQWCDYATAACKTDFTPPAGSNPGQCNRGTQCTTGYCAPNNTCQSVPLPGNCGSHTLTVPASFKDFGATSGPLQGTERSIYTIAADNKSATDSGRKTAAPAGTWVARTPGATISFCPDQEDILLNGSEGGNYVVGGYKNGATCNVAIEPTLLAKVMGNITNTNGKAVTAAAACDKDCGCNLFIFAK